MVRSGATVIALFVGVLEVSGVRVVQAQEDSWSAGEAMLQARARGASCVLNDRIHIIGGSSAGGGPGTNDNQEYNPAADSWRTRAPMINSRLASSGSVVDGRCHVLGGLRANFPRNGLNTHEIYDPASNSWSTAAAMPTARYAHATAVLDGKIWVIGGTPDSSTIFRTVEVYDPASDSWSTGPSIVQPRAAHTADAFQGRIYITGGTQAATGHQYDTVEVYDPDLNQWTLLANMPTARWELASGVTQGRLFTVGGAMFLSAERALEEYNPLTDSWTVRADLPIPAFRVLAEAVGGKLYVFGGLTQVAEGHPASNDTWIYTPLTVESGIPINAGHSGAWFNPDTSGQGQFIDVVPEDQFMFISWFTFTDAASDNPNEQQWYTAQGNYSGDTAVLDLFETLGGKFDDPQEVTTTQVGEVTLTFSDCNQGMMSYSFDEEELLGEFPLIRVIPGSDNVCEGISGNNTEKVDINAGMDGAWFDPATSGQGYFIDAHPDPEGGNFIFVSWFTYGNATASGQRWLTAQGGFEGSMAEIDVFEHTGGSFDDPEAISTTKVGTMSLDFTDCSNAQLSYSLPADPAEGDVAITRVIPGGKALCEELAGAE
jgi:N-acetylneuraminic acid mutarotase